MTSRARASEMDDGVPHHQALELAAADALAAGNAAAALAFADERCKADPAPEAHAFVLRAEANHRLGHVRRALADLAAAIAIAPEDVEANRRLLAWGRGKDQARAAAAIVAADTDTAHLTQAMALLRKSGATHFASVTVLDDAVRGWAAWPAGGATALTIAGDDATVTADLAPDPFHPLATRALSAAAFRLPRPISPTVQVIDLADGDCVFFSTVAPPNAASLAPPAADEGREPGSVTVIVPVYADYAATRRCLALLTAELDAHPRHRAVIVNDAAPDQRMAPYLATIRRHRQVTVLTNTRNLGFVASTNRGFAASGRDDVLLLNADTIPPPGFIDRLQRAATSADDIGIVVPLSNNAELTSFPEPNRDNPLADAEEPPRVDAVAARVNRGRTIDIPAGTGFCLYISRACADALGTLLESFHRGYLEDVDLCLRAREHGFRTVCDPSVFVGHAGSRSFGAEKAALVMRNFRVLRERFPGYAAECLAFNAADPLAGARAAIMAALP